MHQLIRASAGTGKTWNLSGHFLRQLFEGARPETILATTFTRKAAGEILGRLLLRLAESSVDSEKHAELAAAMLPLEVTQSQAAELLRELTRQLHRLRVSTLDSFFQQIARNLTLELGLPPGWSIADDFTDAVLRQRAIDAVLAERDTKDSRQLMQMLAKGRSRRSVRWLIDEAVEGCYELFLQTDPEAWNRIPKATCLSKEDQQICVAALKEIALSGRQQPKTRSADLQRFHDANWSEFLTKGIAAAVSSGRPQFGRQDLSPELINAYEPLVRHARAEILNQIAHHNLAAWQLISRFDTAYQQLRSYTGFTRFSEITRLLARSGTTVEEHRVNYRLDSSFRHLLLDEFQDTSLDQWKVLRRLVIPLVKHTTDNPSSVFCVGDPKQAIYGWRGGIAEVMDEVQATVPGIEGEPLNISRRSAPAVIDTVNQVFQKLHQHKHLEEYGAACHEWSSNFPVHSTHLAELPGFAECRTAPRSSDDSEPDRKTAYNIWVAEQVRNIHLRCPGAKIGVLMRTNDGVAQLVHQLTQLGVPASEEGGTPPTDSPAVLAVMSLLYLSSHPGCTVSRYHVAHSPLARVVGFDEWQDDAAAMATASFIRCRLLDDGYGATLQWIVEAVQDDCSNRDRLRLQQVVSEAWQFDLTSSLNPAEFVQHLKSSRFSRSAPSRVRVMTVHQSKGLEFEIVVAPELTGSLMKHPAVAAGGPGRAAAPEDVCMWVDRGLRHLLPQQLQNAFAQTTDNIVRGSLCLLYVTLTRAVHALHLLIPPETKTTRKTLAGILAAAFSDTEILEEDSQIWKTGNALWFQQVPHTQVSSDGSRTEHQPSTSQLHLAAMTGGRRRALTRRAPSDHGTSRLPLTGQTFSLNDRSSVVDGKTRGTLIHAWFERICWLDQGEPLSRQHLRKIATAPSIQAMHIADTAIELLLTEFLEFIDQTATKSVLTQATSRERFSRLPELAEQTRFDLRVIAERPFVYRDEDSIVHGTIDRLVIAENSGQRLAAEIIDFKSDQIVGEVDHWTESKKEDYRNQLREYRTAVSRCFGIPQKCISSSLLLLEANTCVEVK
ncbi:MAG: UvrD-helicase domain-containing protein [Fuerstiella sp.]|nr:UvrD-helicase domain-containing protein [Fuerstiella sp.]